MHLIRGRVLVSQDLTVICNHGVALQAVKLVLPPSLHAHSLSPSFRLSLSPSLPLFIFCYLPASLPTPLSFLPPSHFLPPSLSRPPSFPSSPVSNPHSLPVPISRSPPSLSWGKHLQAIHFLLSPRET